MYYKVLDVRESIKIGEVKYYAGWDGKQGQVNIPQFHQIIVIAEDIDTGKRTRFVFCKNNTIYEGEYELLIPGDFFTIEESSDYHKVVTLQ